MTPAEPAEPAESTISTHTPLAGRDKVSYHSGLTGGISTHTPLAGRDEIDEETYKLLQDFYSHAPCGT